MKKLIFISNNEKKALNLNNLNKSNMKLKWLAQLKLNGRSLATVHSWMCSSTAVVGSTHQASSTLTVGVAVSISKTTGIA